MAVHTEGRSQREPPTDKERRRRAANEAMDAYARGEPGAFKTLYGLISKELWAFIFARTCHRATAEDLMQQTLLQMHRARGRFRPGANVHPWMFTIAWRLIIDRSRGRRPQVDVRGLGLVDPGPSPHERASASEMCERLKAAIGRLPERQRSALELTRGAGLSQREAAEALGTTPSAIKSLVHRAVSVLDGVRVSAGGAR